MKAVACLVGICLLAGLVSADFGWQVGKQYRYQVRGRVMAGIAEINSQAAGLQLDYVQRITVIEPNVLNVKIEELKAIETNEELSEGGMRDGQIRKGQEAQIPTELRHYLTSPMDMILKKGVVQSIKVQADLPTWAVNIKKAMASTFILDTTGHGGQELVVEGNLNRAFENHHQNSIRANQNSGENQESGFFYETLEQSVHGECEVYYTVSQNGPFEGPFQFERQAQAGVQRGSGSQSSSSESRESREYQGKRQHQNRIYKAYKNAANSGSSSSSESSESSSKEQAWPRAFNQLCQENDQVYEIIKTVNFTACTQKPVLAYSTPAELKFRPADNAGGSLWGRALVSRYVACGQNRQNYTILKISQQERFHNGLRDGEKVIAGAQKNVTLLSIGHGEATKVENSKTINNLVYTFDPKQQELIKDGRIQTAAQMTSTSSSSSSEEKYQQDAAYVNQNQQQQQRRRQYQSSSEERNYRQQKQQKKQQKFQQGQRYQSSAEGKGQLPQPALDQAPLASMLITPLKRDQMKSRVNTLMTEIAQDLTKSTAKDSIAEREVLSKISTVVKILRILNAGGIQELAQKWTQSGNEEQEVARSIFIDALAIAGTNPTVVYLLKQIKSGQLNGEEAAQVLSTLPMYIRTPTRELLEKYFEILDDEAVKRQTQVRTTALLSFSTLLYNACINKQTKNTRYPVALYGEFCNESQVAKKFVPYYIQKLEKRLESGAEQDKHYVIVLLAALGNLGHPDTIEVVQKIMDQETDSFIKTKAIFALKNLIQARSNLNQQFQHQQRQGKTQFVLPVDRQSRDILTNEVVEQQVLPVLVSVAFDKGEHPQVRNAAFSLLFHCTFADIALWQQIAMSTWFEPSRDVRSFVYSSLKSLAELEQPLQGVRHRMSYKARAVLPLAKPIDASIARSHNIFSSKFVEELNSGFATHLSYYQTEDSVFPTHFYYRNYFNFGNGAAGVHPVEFSVAGNTIQKLASAFVEAVTQQDQQGKRTEDRQAHQDLNAIKNLLNIETREQNEPIQGAIYLRLRDEIERMWTFDEQTVQQLAQQLAQNANARGELNVNYQKAAHMAEHLAAMPTIMGFPLVYSMQMPALVSIRGTIKLQQQQQQNGESGYFVQADLSPVYTWKIHRKLSFKVPFTGKKYQAGVQRHVVVEAPFSAVARKAPQGHYQLAITPAHLSAGAPSGTINLVTYHQIPYTAIITDEFYPVNHHQQQGAKMQIVRDNQDRKANYQNKRQFGEKSLGLVFQLEEESDFPEEEENMSGWTKFVRKFHTVNCAFNAAWLGSPSVRFVKRQFTLDLDKSQTKTMVFLLAARRQRTSVARQLQSSEESSREQNINLRQSRRQQSNSQSGSTEFGSSSSSESVEGQNWYTNAQSPKQQQKQQKQQRFQQGQSQSRSSSSSSSESYEQRTSQEQRQRGDRVQGQVMVLAVLGKRAPLESLDELKSSGVQKALQKSSATTVQFLFQLNSNQGKLFSRIAAGEAVNQAAESLPQQSRAFQGIREAVLESSNEKNQPKYCAELKLTIDTPKRASRHIVAIRRETLLAQDLSVKVQGQLSAGTSCKVMPLYVKLQGKLRRDSEMTEWARSKSPEAKKCDQDKKKGFSVSRVCLEVSEQQAAALNQIQLHFQHSPMPKEIKNVTVYHIQNFLKAALYPYMSENQFHESTGVSQNSFEIRARMTPNKQFVSMEIRKPESVLSFNDIKTGRVLKALLPLTATQTPFENIKDRLFRAQAKASCAIEKNYVNTFDNVTYSFNQQAARGCQHVLAQDCSGRYPMAVLVKDLQQNQGRQVTILLGEQTKIQLIPQGRAAPGRLAGISRAASKIFGGKSSSESSESAEAGYSTKSGSRMTVIVNGKTVSLPYTVPSQQQNQQYKNARPIAEVMEMPNGGVQLIARRVKVATDGARVIVYASNAFRNRTCGICGDFNNEKVAEMRSPKDFPLSSGSLLVASYAFNKIGQNQNQQGQSQEQQQGQQCQVDQQVQRQIRKEQQQGEQQDRHIANVHQRGQQYAQYSQQRRQQQQQYRKQQQQYQKQQMKSYRRQFYGSQEQNRRQFGSSSSSSESVESYKQHQFMPYQTRTQQHQQQKQQYNQENQQQFSWFGRRGQSNQNQEKSQSSSSEERQSSLSMTVKQIMRRDGDKLCMTVNRVHVCSPHFEAKSMTTKKFTVICTRNQSKIHQMKQQLEAGQYVDAKQFHNEEKTDMEIRVPKKCVKA